MRSAWEVTPHDTGRGDATPGRLPARPMAMPAWRRPEVWVTVLLVVCDQLSKLLVLQRIGLHETITVIPGLLNLTYVRNTGAAFGMLNAQDFALQAARRRRRWRSSRWWASSGTRGSSPAMPGRRATGSS